MMKRQFVGVLGATMFLMIMFAAQALAADNAPRMTKEALKALLDDPEAEVTIIDVRSATQWEDSEFKVLGAVWEDSKDFESWANFKFLKDQPLVLYCA